MPPTSTSEIVFADLPRIPAEDAPMCIVRRRDPMPDVSRPQDILDPEQYGYRLPPGSILYHNFVRIHGLKTDEAIQAEEEDSQKS